MVPSHVIQSYSENDGIITLHLSKFKSPFFSKWLIPKGKSETIQIRFDKNGSMVWKAMDGRRSVQEICDVIRQSAAGESHLTDLEERSAKFVTELYKSRFINFMEEKK